MTTFPKDFLWSASTAATHRWCEMDPRLIS